MVCRALCFLFSKKPVFSINILQKRAFLNLFECPLLLKISIRLHSFSRKVSECYWNLQKISYLCLSNNSNVQLKTSANAD